MIDPVSGNEVPVGASPQEVRDDVSIQASEGEYIIPANVVRFLGLDKIEKLVSKAKEQLDAMHQNGRIGGEPMLDAQEAPTEEAQAPQAPPTEAPTGMAEGGMVAQPSQQTQSGIRLYTGPDGSTMYVPFLNGQPLYPIPQGYTDSGSASNQSTPATAKTQSAEIAQEGSRERDQNRDTSSPSKPVEKWNTADFVKYGNDLGSFQEGALKMISRAVPFGSQLFDFAQRTTLNEAPQYLDSMIETGLDRDGNPLTQDDIIGLSETREKIRDRVAKESGTEANPFEPLKNFVSRIFGVNQEDTPAPITPIKTPRISQDPNEREGFYGTQAGSADEMRAVTGNILSEYDRAQAPASVPRPAARPAASDDLEAISTNNSSNVGYGPR